jgi:hypothetical protein
MVDDPIDRYGALFERAGDRYVPTPLARGPWDPNALHGGAPSALFAAVCEQHDPGPAAFIARMTIELLGPIPLAPLTLAVETIRPGRKVQWLVATLSDEGGRAVSRATVLRLRNDEVNTTGAVHPEVQPVPRHDAAAAATLFPADDRAVGYWSAHDVRLVRGSWMEPGPAVAWFRLRCPVIAGAPVSPVTRVAACADFGSGVGNALRYTQANAINPEVTIHLHRHPATDWIGLESEAWTQPHGVGLAESRLHDERGVIGRAAQTLLVEPAAVRQINV